MKIYEVELSTSDYPRIVVANDIESALVKVKKEMEEGPGVTPCWQIKRITLLYDSFVIV